MVNHGHLIGEIVRRISGKPLKQFIADELADPLGAEFSLGVPEEKWARTADVIPPPPMELPEGMDPQGIAMRAFTNPIPNALAAMSPGFRGTELGAANGFGNARSLARIGSIVSLSGTVDGNEYLSSKMIHQMIQERLRGPDLVMGMNLRMGLGVGLPVPDTLPYVPEGNICFWCGWGGSMVVMDLDRRMTIAYAMNKMGPGLVGNDNSQAYVKAIYEIMATR
jgi:CubicO group peptidase (beta-lactamase class C family)